MNNAGHAIASLLLTLFMVLAWHIEAHACGGYPEQPEPVQIACAAC